MARCEACGGSVRNVATGSRPKDMLIDVTLFEFSAEVGYRRGRRTHFCSYDCARRGLDEDLLNRRDDPTLWVNRNGDGPQRYPEPLAYPMVDRARELLEDAMEQTGDADAATDALEEAIEAVESVEEVLGGYPSTNHRCREAAQLAVCAAEDGESLHDAIDDVVIEFGVKHKRGRVWNLAKEVIEDAV